MMKKFLNKDYGGRTKLMRKNDSIKKSVES